MRPAFEPSWRKGPWSTRKTADTAKRRSLRHAALEIPSPSSKFSSNTGLTPSSRLTEAAAPCVEPRVGVRPPFTIVETQSQSFELTQLIGDAMRQKLLGKDRKAMEVLGIAIGTAASNILGVPQMA